MVSAAVPPVMVSTLATVAVLAKLLKVERVVAGAEIDGGCDRGGARVMVSAPVPPVSVSTLATVRVLVLLAKVSVSPPAPRSMEALATAVSKGDGVGAGAADQGGDVADGAGVADVGEGQLVGSGCRDRPRMPW